MVQPPASHLPPPLAPGISASGSGRLPTGLGHRAAGQPQMVTPLGFGGDGGEVMMMLLGVDLWS